MTPPPKPQTQTVGVLLDRLGFDRADHDAAIRSALVELEATRAENKRLRREVDEFALAIGYAEDGREFGHDGVMRPELPALAKMLNDNRQEHFEQIDRTLALEAEVERLRKALDATSKVIRNNLTCWCAKCGGGCMYCYSLGLSDAALPPKPQTCAGCRGTGFEYIEDREAPGEPLKVSCSFCRAALPPSPKDEEP